MLDNKFVTKQTMLKLVSKNSLSFKAFKVNGEVYMNCLTKTTSDPNPAVYILCSYRCYCWQGSTRRCHPTHPIGRRSTTIRGHMDIHPSLLPIGPRSLFALHLPSLTPSVQSGAGTQVKSPQTSSATRSRIMVRMLNS